MLKYKVGSEILRTIKYFLKNLIKKRKEIGDQDQCFIEHYAQMLLLEDLTGVHTIIHPKVQSPTLGVSFVRSPFIEHERATSLIHTQD